MTVTFIVAERRWVCPNCPFTDVTHEAQPHTRYHTCPGLKGLTAPMIPAGVHAKVSAVEREDYLNGDTADRVMSVITEREDGNDVTVFAPTSTGTGDSR